MKCRFQRCGDLSPQRHKHLHATLCFPILATSTFEGSLDLEIQRAAPCVSVFETTRREKQQDSRYVLSSNSFFSFFGSSSWLKRRTLVKIDPRCRSSIFGRRQRSWWRETEFIGLLCVMTGSRPQWVGTWAILHNKVLQAYYYTGTRYFHIKIQTMSASQTSLPVAAPVRPLLIIKPTVSWLNYHCSWSRCVWPVSFFRHCRVRLRTQLK